MIDGMTYRERATSIIDAVLWRSVIEPAQERTRIMPDGCAVPIPVQPIGVEPRFRPIQRQRPVRSARSPRTGKVISPAAPRRWVQLLRSDAVSLRCRAP